MARRARERGRRSRTRSREHLRTSIPVIGMLVLLLVVVGAFAATRLLSTDDVTRADVPQPLLDARPTMSAEDGRFILEGQRLGVSFTPEALNADIETAHTVCWALSEGKGAVGLKELAVHDDGSPLGTTGEDLRSRRVMSAGVAAYCPSFDAQRGQLGL